jgi:hypothetical protein
LLAVALASCGNSFAREVEFQAPAGWIHAPGPQGSDNWLNPGGSEFIMARTFDTPTESAAVIARRTQITICRNQTAYFAKDRFENNKPAEYVYSDWDGKRHMAVYVRNAGAPANPAAEAALRTICKKNK